MEKIIIVTVALILTTLISVSAFGYYKFNFKQDDAYVQMPTDTVVAVTKHNEVSDEDHPSWDQNHDGVNDCVIDFSCDDNIDYSRPFEFIVEP